MERERSDGCRGLLGGAGWSSRKDRRLSGLGRDWTDCPGGEMRDRSPASNPLPAGLV